MINSLTPMESLRQDLERAYESLIADITALPGFDPATLARAELHRERMRANTDNAIALDRQAREVIR